MKTARDVTILFVDDEPDLLSSLRRFLRKEPYQKLFAGSGSEALEILATQPVDIVVSDLRMPEMDGMALLTKVKAAYPVIIRLILSANRDVEQTIETINTGEVYRYISKPLDPASFKRILKEVVEYHLLIIERQETMTEIEKRLLQARPPRSLTGAKIAATMIPAGHLDGDFADYFVYDDHHVDILVGDVMGKGVQSAMIAASIKNRFAKSLALADGWENLRMSCPTRSNYDITSPSQIISSVHAMCIESMQELEIFATLCYARLDLAAGQMSLVDCGHLPVIHFQKKTGACQLIKSENLAMGFAKQQAYQVVPVTLSAGDVLIFYSDGVTEAHSPAGELYGVHRLANTVRTYHHLSPNALLEKIETDVKAFSTSDRFDDDYTCVAVSIEAVET